MTPNEWERELSERLARLTPSRAAEERVVASVRGIVEERASKGRLPISSRRLAMAGLLLALLWVASLRPKRPRR